jgi:SPP1 gp7 family putative phage head morphogenesis protein
LTYGERRKRADVQLILKDMDELESAFLSKTRKLNEKRQAQMVKRVEKILTELEEAFEKGDEEEVEGILASLQVPSGKEWRKHIHSLVFASAKAGVLRAHVELLRLRELYEFAEDSWGNSINIVPEAVNFTVEFPKEAEDWLKEYAYEIGVITEETVLTRIRAELMKSLHEGTRGRDTVANIKAVAGTWMSQRHAETIARTETAKMYNAGRIARWLDPEQNGFVEALQYDAIVDTRTTDLCKKLDGKIIAVSNGAAVAKYTPPNHFKCRATWLPVSKYEEWKDDFPTDLEPEKGFQFEAPLPNMLKGKTKEKPLVVPKKDVNLKTLKDPDIIRTLSDEDFKAVIGNIDDQALKLSLIKERAEQMLVRNNGLKEKTSGKFKTVGITANGKPQSKAFVFNDKSFDFFYNAEIAEAVGALQRLLWAVETLEEARAIYEEWKPQGIDMAGIFIAEFLVGMDNALKEDEVEVTWDGLNKVERTAQAQKYLTIKTPPKTRNYKLATGLQQAVADGQAWMDKFVDDKLVPASGILLKFQHDLRRAYAQGAGGTIHFGKYEKDAGVVVHESAHVMHWNNKEVADLIHEFYEQRTKGEAMSKYMGEDTKPDHFYNKYVGRVYGWESSNLHLYKKFNRVTHGFMGQEVLSMGMQAMYTDPLKFYRDDKEHFLLTYAIMHGLF